MQTFKELRTESVGQGERNDCAVIALAVVARQTYATAHRAMAARGRRPRGRSNQGACEAAARDLGLSTVHLFGWDWTDEKNVTHKALPPGHALRKAKTMTSAEQVLRRCYPGRRFLISCRGHIAAFDGHTLQDWSQGRRHHVTKIVEVI